MVGQNDQLRPQGRFPGSNGLKDFLIPFRGQGMVRPASQRKKAFRSRQNLLPQKLLFDHKLYYLFLYKIDIYQSKKKFFPEIMLERSGMAPQILYLKGSRSWKPITSRIKGNAKLRW
jgi:hypothetical protein